MASQLSVGTTGPGSPAGSSPIVATGSCATTVTTLTRTIAMIEPGSRRWILGATNMMAATTSTIARAHAASGQRTVASACTAATSAFVLGPGSVPSAAGTCWRKMMIAMPRVNPSITGHGM